MTVFGLIVVFTIVWWMVFFTALPFAVRRQENVQLGHDPGAPANPMLWRKTAITTAITCVLVGGAWLADDTGLIDIRTLVFGEPPSQNGA